MSGDQEKNTKLDQNHEHIARVNFIFQKYLQELDVAERKGRILKEYIESMSTKQKLRDTYSNILNIT